MQEPNKDDILQEGVLQEKDENQTYKDEDQQAGNSINFEIVENIEQEDTRYEAESFEKADMAGAVNEFAEGEKAGQFAEHSESADENKAMEKDEIACASAREYYYEEKVKKKSKNRNGWLKFVSGVVIASMVGGGSMGAGYGVVKHYFLQDQTAVTRTPVSAVTVQRTSSTATNEGLSEVEIVKMVKPSVVSIATKVTGRADYFGSFSIPYEASGMGSGIIFYSDDTKVAIATNNHVIENANAIYVMFDENTSVEAKVVGTKTDSDLAVLVVNWEDLKNVGINNIVVATFGDSDALEVGERVVAIGNAMGMGLSATNGIISMTEQTIAVDNNELTVLQTSAAINSGNSGGALVNSAGQVIGINTAKYNSSMAEGMGYAIPSNVITPIVSELLENGTLPTPYIGITGTSITSENADLYKLPVGALILEVSEGGPAAEAGIQVGDIITEFNGKTIMDMNVLVEAISEVEIGQTVNVHIVRNGESGMDLEMVVQDKNA